MKTIWIIGAGKFGLRAVKQLARDRVGSSMTMVDQDQGALDQARDLGCATVHDDGVRFLWENLGPGTQVDWIIPAVPVHLAWEWVQMTLGDSSLARADLPGELQESLPNPMAGQSGDLYVSHADFLCPAHCSEPESVCTKTGEPRKQDLFRLLAAVAFPGIRPFVVQSVQLGPGVGGYRPRALLDLAQDLGQHQGACFVATACRCHGVVTGARRI